MWNIVLLVKIGNSKPSTHTSCDDAFLFYLVYCLKFYKLVLQHQHGMKGLWCLHFRKHLITTGNHNLTMQNCSRTIMILNINFNNSMIIFTDFLRWRNFSKHKLTAALIKHDLLITSNVLCLWVTNKLSTEGNIFIE